MSANPCDVNTVRCAVCGKLREQANHWFLVWLTFGFHCYPFERWMTGRRNAAIELVANSACYS